MKFKLDENMPADLASWLTGQGFDVENVTDEGMSGKDDSLILQAATREGRVLITFDLDFADVRQYPPGSHAGIVVLRMHDQRWQAIRGPIERFFAGPTLETLSGGLAVVDEVRVRIRKSRRR